MRRVLTPVDTRLHASIRLVNPCSWLLVSFQKRWVNLWPPENVAETFIPIDIESDDGGTKGASPGATSGISSAVFMGNFVLFASLLTGIFLVHVALASGVEAYWLTKVCTCVGHRS